MSQPSVTWSLNWGTNTAQKLSGKVFYKPDGTYVDCTKVDGTITPKVTAKQIYITSVKEDGRDYGFIDDVLVDIRATNPTGHKILDVTSGVKDNPYSFSVSVQNHLTDGDGIYRIGLYIQDNDGYWNYEYFFIVTEGGNFVLSDNSNLQVTTQTN